MAHAFITWDAALGRRMCPLATFGSRAPVERSARLVCVDPPRADRAELTNADDVRGAIALVVRGGCSFLEKARRIERAGAVAMILANNTREAPFEMFTMAADASDAPDAGDDAVSMPCVMMCLYDVRELFKQYPPSVKTGVLTLEIAATPDREQELVAECEAARQLVMQQPQASGAKDAQDDTGGGGGWGAALKRTTTSLIKRWEVPAGGSPRSSVVATAATVKDPTPSVPASEATTITTTPARATAAAADLKPKQPLFAFVQWATSASEFVLFFAPLSDFCLVANNAVYEGKRVVCDPLLAHEETLRNARELVDAIALVQRGACTFPAKLERIQRCGAAAAIVGNDDAEQEDAAFVMSVDHIKVDHVTIPAVMVSRRVFARLVESDRPAQLRILCLSGEAAAECLARAGGQVISMRDFTVEDEADDDGESKQQSPLERLLAACRAGDHGACQRVLDETCEDERARRELVMARDKWQRTALHHACAVTETVSAGREHVVALLLRLGAQANACDVALNSPLHFACLRGHASSVKKLLSASPLHGQELTTARNLGGATPIHYAAMAGSTACLELVLSVNARRVEHSDAYCFDGVDARDVDGATPLHVACDTTHVDCVLYLVAANADLTVRDNAGRTPLEVACARVNEPTQSLQALHIVEKLMDAGAPVVVGDDDQSETLAIDSISSKAIKRELEIAFLRREALQSRARFRELTQQLHAQNERMGALAAALEAVQERHEAAQRVASERERRLTRQQKQIEQLQLQMKMLLTVLHSNAATNTPASESTALLLSTHELVHAAAPSLPIAAKEALDEDDDITGIAAEAARAQDAALARDLGKKCCRERQFALAQTYFERSLEVFALPGVARLLEETKALRREAEAARPHHRSRTGPRQNGAKTTAVDDTDHDDARRLRGAIATMEASPRTKDALEREIAKLEAMEQGASEYSATLKWIEWLLALPWSNTDDATGGSGSHGLLALEASMFDEIERMENEQRRRRERDAARLIQRTFRERYAVHLLRRAMASARIQRVYRERRRRREQQRLAALAVTRHRHRSATMETPSPPSPEAHEEEMEEEEEAEEGGGDNSDDFDVSTTLDRRAERVCHRKRTRVVRGDLVETKTQFTVLQLLASDPIPQRSLAAHDTQDNGSESTTFHVWKRWGTTKTEARQSTLSGPYEDIETATTRYERLLREARAMGAVAALDGESTVPAGPSKDPTQQVDAPPSVASAWTWLRASAS